MQKNEFKCKQMQTNAKQMQKACIDKKQKLYCELNLFAGNLGIFVSSFWTF